MTMSEKDKMLAGLEYDCGDSELLALWHHAKDLVKQYNNLPSADLETKEKVLREMLGGFGKNLWITQPFYVDYGKNIFFGNNVEVNMNCTFLDDNKIEIGDNALIAPNVQIYTAYHPTNAADRFGAQRKMVPLPFVKQLQHRERLVRTAGLAAEQFCCQVSPLAIMLSLARAVL